MEVKTCVSCKSYQGADNVYAAQMTPQLKEPQCKNENAATRDLVYGTCYCHQERASKKGCGQAGKLWEAK